MHRMFMMILAAWLVLGGCAPGWYMPGEGTGTVDSGPVDGGSDGLDGEGGGQDDLTVHMPFGYGYTSQCVQGTGGGYSHAYNSTRYDVDLDTPNNVDDPVFAPAFGTAYVHNDGANAGFGLHINLELPDGSFLVMGHLADAFVESGEEVAMGQLIGVEGTTGNSTGDHVHFGRHTGNARVSAGQSTSVVGLRMYARNVTTGSVAAHPLSQMVCGIPGGHYFRSQLETPLWHPEGSLVKGYGSEEVYLLKDGRKHHIANESVFHAHRWSFFNTSLVTPEELECYGNGPAITEAWATDMRYTDGELWLLDGPAGNPSARRYRVPLSAWEGIARSWGLSTSGGLATYSQEPGDSALSAWQNGGTAKFRDGTLLKESGRSAIYVVTGGSAAPIETWHAFLLLDYNRREIVEVPQGQVASVQGAVGSCATGEGCITVEHVLSCGGAGFGPAENPDQDSDTEPDTDIDTEPDTDADTEPHRADWYLDADGDGYGRTGEFIYSATRPTPFYVLRSGDCNDLNAAINPAAHELCDGEDNNCNGAADDGLTFTTYYGDIDGDGYGSTDYFLTACAQPPAYVPRAGDCNDLDINSYPGAPESCDNVDNDCDGIIDDNEECADPCSCN